MFGGLLFLRGMNKRKLQSFYIFIGLFALILVNYPIIASIAGGKAQKIPVILLYLFVVALFVSLAGFILEKKDK
ncbi:MAG: hypothetical protein BGO87_07060 [Flavobacteriia bacterium 40-80]|nr:MAG: hypothetical protein BGO87_07060 [Flavobacteriia bacterium 40-80]